MSLTLVALQAALAAFTIFYLVTWFRSVARAKTDPSAPAEVKTTGMPTVVQIFIGAITNFFDTLGIGSFAPTTATYKFFKVVPDRLIPGTLNVGHTLPTITEAFIFTAAIAIDPLTLVLMIGAAVLGAWRGAGIVASWPKRNVQIGMGVALLVAAVLFAWRNLGGTGTTEGTTALTGVSLVLGLIGNFLLGALMTLGIGMYAPCMILVGLLGMNATAAFPIMMGSCAFLMPVSSEVFVRKQAYSLKPALGLAIGGVPAVFLAAYGLTSLPLYTVRWLVVGVVTIAATMMLRSAAKGE
jgi:uncharacterized membrane protein YfcA